VTGDIIPFGESRKPSPDAASRIKAAKASLPEHDPHQDLLDALWAAIQVINPATRSDAPIAALNDDQVKALIYQTERAAERGVGLYATRIRSWHQAIVGGAFVAGLLIGCAGVWWWHPRADIGGMTCQDEANGGRVCFVWVKQPGQPAKR
jgi:hypothetical protein